MVAWLRAVARSRRPGAITDMTEPKTNCTTCGREILVATADRNGGLCGPCRKNVNRPRTQYVYKQPPPVSRGELDEYIISKPAAFIIEALFDPACDKVNFRPDEMTEGDEIVYTVWTFLGEVCNGGIQQYLGNQSGGWAHRCGPSLRKIAASHYAEIIEAALSSFTTKGALPRTAWENDLDAFEDGKYDPFEKFDERFFAFYHANKSELTDRLYLYICANRDVFAPFGVG